MTTPGARVDDVGIHLVTYPDGPVDLLIAGDRIWSCVPGAGGRPGDAVETTLAFPRALRRRLVGTARVQVVDESGAVLVDDDVVFGGSTEPLDLTDKHGNKIVIDKWGLVQRPLENRRASGVVELMVDQTARILEVLRDDCGVPAWLAFGTLLGAAREGRAIGHDSDIDLCYLSEQPTPALMAQEMWQIARTLRRAGMVVDIKSASFITVVIDAPDGGTASIDLYTAFFLDGLLHETATVRTEVPRSAVLPLGTITFEGREFPAPADVAAILAVSYGPSWRVPDPSFEHRPGREVARRFDGWFGQLMRGRREWRRTAALRAEAGDAPSDFARFVHERLRPGSSLVEIGMGSAADLAFWAESGHRCRGLDYATPVAARRRARAAGAAAGDLNLYDLRDVITRGALLARGHRLDAVCVRDVFEALDPDGVEHLWLLLRLSLDRGGLLFVEGVSWSREDAAAWPQRDSGPVRSFDPDRVLDEVRRLGARVVHREGVAEGRRAARGGPPARWRFVIDFPARASADDGTDIDDTDDRDDTDDHPHGLSALNDGSAA
ncbi:hypothetical protein [Nocardioides rubriscoriae]|uniref:hypothetical protein n=1 Tax=Nocardioides rubriscoriae TaxID=642762 RepID=UPI001478B6E3|nr:hypothetical protein [Nocardioides rubriscoriae]